MGTPKRDRQKAARQARIDQARAEEARRKRNRTVRNAALFVALVVVIALVVARPWQSDDDEVAAEDPTSTTVGDGEFAYGTGECPAEDGSSPQQLTFEDAPQLCIDPEVTYTAEIVTSEGEVTVELDAAAAPGTVNNFVVLARYGFYDDVAFHRIIQGFVNQTGDPTGEPAGTGDPGYAIADELPADASAYVAGSVAMANSGPNTGGGQFFVVVGDGGSQLQPLYSLFGQVVEGQEVMDAINAEFGEAAGGAGTPTGDVRVESVTIVEADAADADESTTTTGDDGRDATTTTSETDAGDPAPTDGTSTTTGPDESTTTTAG